MVFVEKLNLSEWMISCQCGAALVLVLDGLDERMVGRLGVLQSWNDLENYTRRRSTVIHGNCVTY